MVTLFAEQLRATALRSVGVLNDSPAHRMVTDVLLDAHHLATVDGRELTRPVSLEICADVTMHLQNHGFTVEGDVNLTIRW